MVTVRRLNPDYSFRTLYMPNRVELSRSVRERHFSGQPMAALWQPITVAPVTDREQHRLPLGSCAMLDGSIPVLSSGAAEALMPLLAPHGELLPVNMLGEIWYAFNTTTIIDALDFDRSNVVYFEGTKRPMWVKHYVLRSAVISSPIFKLPEQAAPIFTTDSFKVAYTVAQLTGLDFESCDTHD